MRSLQTILLIIGVACFFSCKKEHPSSPCEATHYPVQLALLDSMGRDLLNPATPNHYMVDSAWFSYTENSSVYYIEPFLTLTVDTSQHFFINADLNSFASNHRTFFLKLTATDTDTLILSNEKAFDSNGCYYYNLTELKYNNIPHLFYTLYGGSFPFTIIK